MALFYYKYNNYYNRRLKREDTLSDYSSYLVYNEINCNFNPNDGITTQITVGRAENKFNCDVDYVIYSRNGVEITSRWFVMESHFNRSGQRILYLQRDVVADYYNEIVNADAFIEKATLPSESLFILNKENISVNQIKQSETLLKDETGMPWLVGYVDRKYSPTDKIQLNPTELVADIQVDYLDDWKEGYPYILNKGNQVLYNSPYTVRFDFEVRAGYDSWLHYRNYELIETSKDPFSRFTNHGYGSLIKNRTTFNNWLQENKADIQDTFSNYASLYFSRMFDSQLFNDLLKTDGKILYAAKENTYYRISVHTLYGDLFYDNITSDKSGQYLSTWLTYKFASAPLTSLQGAQGRLTPAFAVTYRSHVLYLTIETLGEEDKGTYYVNFPGTKQRLHLKDAPYDMFCIPFGENVDVKNGIASFDSFTQSRTNALALAQDLAAQLGTNLFDLQLLPYCPLTGLVTDGEKVIDINNSDTKRWTTIYTANDKPAAVMIWSTASSGHKVLDIQPKAPAIKNKKIVNECCVYRMVSPNYNGTFEFNPARNDMTIGPFVVDFTYIPYNPFVRVAPKFSGLYGGEFKDSRGLILNGDYSICYLSDAWKQYQINNKNYLNMFDREVENIEVQNKYQNIQNIVGATVGSLQGGLSGGTMGSLAGPIGTGIGAAVGTAFSMAGGIADIAMTKQLQAEALDYKRDMFGFQLDNIKALPNSIAKTTAYSAINKLYPILEYYVCTDEELKAVANKIAYNGMTVGVIGKIIDYTTNSWSYAGIEDKGYIKGKIIRIDIDDDFHLVATISDEINKGVYLK